MTDEQRRSAIEEGQQIILAEVFDAIATLEAECGATSYGRGQLRILHKLVGMITEP
jgi:hypothetical protein